MNNGSQLPFSALAGFFLLIFSLSACKKDDPVGPGPGPVGGDLEGVPYNPQAYTIVKPSHFPDVPVPASNPMTVDGVQLGRRLFYDPILSGDSTMSCSSCHLPVGSFTDNKALSLGIAGLAGRRSSMSLLNIAYANNGLFWDGRASTLEDQALMPVEDEKELHHLWPEVIEQLKVHPTYPALFRKAFGINDRDDISKELTVKALAQFERILISSGTSKFDRFQYGGEPNAIDDEEFDGVAMALREGGMIGLPDAQCFHCHGGVMLTGNQYFSNGLDSVGSFNDFTDPGRGAITGKLEDNGKFRAPSLRNIALTAPYMHDGRFKTLEEVLDHYGNHGNSKPPFMDPLIIQIGFPGQGPNGGHSVLTTAQKQAIIKFLHTLTDTAFVNNPDIQNPF